MGVEVQYRRPTTKQEEPKLPPAVTTSAPAPSVVLPPLSNKLPAESLSPKAPSGEEGERNFFNDKLRNAFHHPHLTIEPKAGEPLLTKLLTTTDVTKPCT